MKHPSKLLSQLSAQIHALSIDLCRDPTALSDASEIFCEILNQTNGYNLQFEKTVGETGIILCDRTKSVCFLLLTAVPEAELSWNTFIKAVGKQPYHQAQIRITLVLDPSHEKDTLDVMSLNTLLSSLQKLSDNRLLQIAQLLKKKIGDSSDLPKPPDTSALFIAGSRDREFQDILDHLNRRGFAFLWGENGVGKTQTALQFALKYADEYEVCFLPFVSPMNPDGEALYETLHQLPLTKPQTRNMGYASPAKMYQDRLDVLSAKAKRCSILVILDDVDLPELYRERSFCALLETRVKVLCVARCPVRESAIRILPLPKDALIQMLERHGADSRYSPEQLRELAELLHTARSTALARQVTAILGQMPDILSYHALRQMLVSARSVHEAAELLVPVLRPALEALPAAQQQVLRFACVIPDGGLNTELFLYCLGGEYRSSAKRLAEAAWLYQEETLTYLHPFVRTAVQYCLKPTFGNCNVFLSNLWLYDRGIFWNKLTLEQRKLLWHQIGDTFFRATDTLDDAGSIFARRCAAFRKLTHRYAAAAEYEKLSAELEENDPWFRAFGYHLAGECSSMLGRYAQAHDYWQRTLELCRNAEHISDPDLAAAYYHVACAELALEQHLEARQHLEQALELHTRTSDRNHPLYEAIYEALDIATTKLNDRQTGLRHRFRTLVSDEDIRKQIAMYLSLMNTQFQLKSQTNLFDINLHTENFYCGLLNLILDTELTSLNTASINHSAIDLADDKRGIGVLFCANGSRIKVANTLRSFTKQGLHKKYRRLIVFIVGKKPKYQKGFDDTPGFSFDPDGDIWDSAKLFTEICALNAQKMESVLQYLQHHMDHSAGSAPHFRLPVPRREDAALVIRETDLQKISAALERRKNISLTGPAGIGKTTLICQYANYIHRGNAYYVPCSGSLSETIAGMASGLPGAAGDRLDENELCALVLEQLALCPATDLLIIDSLDNYYRSFHEAMDDPIYSALLELDIRTVFVSRFSAPDAVSVDIMSRNELHELFRLHGVNAADEEIAALITAAEGHTLIVSMMAHLLGTSPQEITPAQLLEVLHDGLHSENQSDVGMNRRQRQFYRLLNNIFRVSEVSAEHQDLLRFAALLPANGMSLPILDLALTQGQLRSIRKLAERGFLSMEGDLLQIHSVVRLVCREELKPDSNSCDPILNSINKTHQDTYHAGECAQLAELFANAAAEIPQENGWYHHNAGWYYHKLGQYRNALVHELRAVELYAKSADAYLLATSYNNLAMTYYHLGGYVKALKNLHYARDLYGSVPSPDQQALARVHSNEGRIFIALGNSEHALTHYLRATQIQEAILPEEHPELAQSYNSLGDTYLAMGNHEMAMEYILKALELRTKVLPADHPDLAQSLSSVGHAYIVLGEYEDALDHLRQALAIRERILPPEHPVLAVSYADVGYAHGCLSEYSRALEYLLNALTIQENGLPAEHPDLANSYTQIGHIYHALGDHPLALDYYHRALQIREKALLPNHPLLAQSYSSIANACSVAGDYRSALEYSIRALGVQKKVLPRNHPDLAVTYQALCRIYSKLGDHQKALDSGLNALELLEKIIPEDDLELASAHANVGSSYVELADHAAALLHYEAALAISLKKLPAEHPQIHTLKNIISWLKSQ